MGKLIGALLVAVGTIALDTAVIYYLWNGVLVHVFEPVATVSFLQALGLKFLVSALRGGK